MINSRYKSEALNLGPKNCRRNFWGEEEFAEIEV